MNVARRIAIGLVCLTAGCQTTSNISAERGARVEQPIAVPGEGERVVDEPARTTGVSTSPVSASPITHVTRRNLSASEQPTPVPSVLPVAFFDGDDRVDVWRNVSTDPAAMSLETLEQLALANHPAVARAAAKVRAMRGKWVQAGLPPNPAIGYVGAEMGNEGTAGQQGAFVAQQLITGGKLRLSQSVVAAEIRQACQEYAARRQRVLTDVRIGYYEVLIAQRRIALAGELVSISDQAAETSRQLFRVQDISRVALLQSEIEVQTSRILLGKAEYEKVGSWRRLSAVLGTGDFKPTPLEGDLEHLAEDVPWDEALAGLLDESPEVAAAVARRQRAAWAWRRARAGAIPNVNVQVTVQRDNVTTDTLTGVQVGLPLPLRNRNQGAIAQSRAELSAAKRNVDRVAFELERRLATVFQQRSIARFQVDRYAQDILPTAKMTFGLVADGYRQGEIGYLELLTAQRTYFQTSLAYLGSLREYWRASSQIDGLLLDGSLGDETR